MSHQITSVAQGLRLQKEEPVALERLVAVDRAGMTSG